VASLEAALGVQLLQRTTRKVTPSTAGTALYAQVAPALGILREAVGNLPERAEEPSGELRLTAPTDIGAVVLPELIARFTLRFPRVRVDAIVSNRMVDMVAEGVDVALRISGRPLKDSTLVARKVSALDAAVYASPVYLARAGVPRTSEEAAGHAWVSFRNSPLPRSIGPLRVPPRARGDDMFFVREAVRASVGLALLPSFLVQEDVEAGRLVRVLPRISEQLGTLYLAYPRTQHVPRKVEAFRDLLLEHLAQRPLALRPQG
jgi:DNA-binding transcriptional LysR family regulator